MDVQRWSGGYLAQVTVLNEGDYLMPWTISAQLAPGDTLYSGWNADVSLEDTTLTATAPDWNRSLSAGEEATVGFVTAGTSTVDPAGVALNGVTCTTG